MRFPLIAVTAAGLAGAAFFATPAAALDPPGASSHRGNDGVKIHRGKNRFGGEWASGERRRHHDDDAIWVDHEYTGDTLFRPNGFNDWWHDQPHRNRPAWVMTNSQCDRQYWMGGAWRC